MKLAILAASTLVAVVSLAPASLAQGEKQTAQEISVFQQPTTPAPRLSVENARPPAGMLPVQNTGPARSFAITPSSELPNAGADVRGRLGIQ
jgi:hypothetical protein